MKEIQLTNNFKAKIDDEDFERVKNFYWFADVIRGIHTVYVYACTTKQVNYKVTNTYLHRLIMNAQKGTFVDHINGDTLDCQKSNLRICSCRQNNHNQRVIKGKVPFKGVYQVGKKFYSQIRLKDGTRKRLGSFFTAEAAAKAYDEEALKDRGEFAVLNFLPDGSKNDKLILS